MLCRIADLFVDVPEVGDLPERCNKYLSNEKCGADIYIRTEHFRKDAWKSLTGANWFYAESGWRFMYELLNYEGLVLHASAIEVEGKAYLFSGISGTGKSTHTRLWEVQHGEAARIINDDKPVIRCCNNIWHAYGTPWSGKEGKNANIKAPIAGICFLRQGENNIIRGITKQEAVLKLIEQTAYKFNKKENLIKMLTLVEKLVETIPMYEFENRPEPEAAKLSYETMRRTAEEMGL